MAPGEIEGGDGPGNADIEQSPLLFQMLLECLGPKSLTRRQRQQSLLKPGNKHYRELEPLGGMEGGERHRLGPCIVDHGITEFLELYCKSRERTVKGQGQVT